MCDGQYEVCSDVMVVNAALQCANILAPLLVKRC